MKLVDKLQIYRFTRQWVMLTLAFISLLSLYVLGRVTLRQEQLSFQLFWTLLIYSFAEGLPVMLAFNAHWLQRRCTRQRDHSLLRSYRSPSPWDAWRLWPALLPCLLFSLQYVYFIKPDLKQKLKGEIQFYQTDATHPVPLSGGWLWKKNGALWSKFDEKEQIALTSHDFRPKKGELILQQGTMSFKSKDQSSSMTFEHAIWPTQTQEGLRWLDIKSLIRNQHYFEIWHRFNLPLFLITLTFLSYHLGQTKSRWSSGLFGLAILTYLILFHLTRNSENLKSFSPLLAILPSLSPFAIHWLTRRWK